VSRDKQQEKQGELWDAHELQEKEPDFKTWVKIHKAPELWRLTWERCLELCHCGGSMVSWEGHVIAGRDKPLDQVGIHYARSMYLHTLKMAHEAGREIPQGVL